MAIPLHKSKIPDVGEGFSGVLESPLAGASMAVLPILGLVAEGSATGETAGEEPAVGVPVACGMGTSAGTTETEVDETATAGSAAAG